MLSPLIFIVPSRQRADKIPGLIDAFNVNRTFAELLIATDLDDPDNEQYRVVMNTAPEWVKWRVAGCSGMVAALNHWAAQKALTYAAVGFMGDDHRPRTPGFDQMLINPLMGAPGISYGNDLLQGANLPTHVVVSSVIIRQLGYMVPRTLRHLYADNFWKAIGTATDRLHYVPECVVEHMHPVAGKGEWDDVYRNVNSGEMYARDGAAFQTYVADWLADDIAKIKEIA